MTEEEIKLNALSYLGLREAPDFVQDKTAEVSEINKKYSTTLDFSLCRYIWNFATKHSHLTGKIELTNQKYKFQFTLPEDFLYLQGQYTTVFETVSILDFEFREGYFYSNYEDVFIRYTARINPAYMPVYFTDYFGIRLAFEICDLLTGDSDLKNTLYNQERMSFLEAKNIDARQKPPKVFKNSPFVDARN